MGAYNDTGSRGWPVMAMWSQDFDAPYNMAKLSCVRAANASSGSATPGWNGTITNGTTTSIGTRSHALPLGLALGSLLLVFGVIVL
ncbi:hypothetical protein GQ53DRAFT_744064 [Thozetella sp. PMI_491]|nr:hypothetical protein GQ53DRAFT_744064 [Thozetella sp. PMI_491]